MYTTGRKWLIDAHNRMNLHALQQTIVDLNTGKISPSIMLNKKTVGELVNAVIRDNKILVEILWYDNTYDEFTTLQNICYVGMFQIMQEIQAQK